MFLNRFLVTVIVVLLTAGAAGSQAAEPSEVFRQSRRFIVSVTTENSSGTASQGSGVIIAKNEIITNCHVIDKAERIFVDFNDGNRHPAQMLGNVKALDLCALSVETNDRGPAEIVPIAAIKIGQKVFAIGSPMALDQTLSDGLISGLRRSDTYIAIQTTAAISPGSSGGGLFDSSGRLLGITTFTIKNSQNLNFAIPAQYIQTIGISRQQAQARAPQVARPFTFKGMPFGSSVAKFVEEFPGAVCNQEESALDSSVYVRCRGGPIEYLGRFGGYDATFVRDKLSYVGFTWGTLDEDPRLVAQQLEARAERYLGAPTKSLWTTLTPGQEGIVTTWNLGEGQSMTIGFCTLFPPFCIMNSAKASLSDANFSSGKSPKKDF